MEGGRVRQGTGVNQPSRLQSLPPYYGQLLLKDTSVAALGMGRHRAGVDERRVGQGKAHGNGVGLRGSE